LALKGLRVFGFGSRLGHLGQILLLCRAQSVNAMLMENSGPRTKELAAQLYKIADELMLAAGPLEISVIDTQILKSLTNGKRSLRAIEDDVGICFATIAKKLSMLSAMGLVDRVSYKNGYRITKKGIEIINGGTADGHQEVA
jgi:predicted transcriptional regulator